jgi:DNA polymerase III sliding clamp (beta) subunit (PCNA family)
LRVIWSDRINMHFVNNTSPIVVTEPDGTWYKYIIRPVK